jgi:CheY-specific phosphatase CheX
MIHKEPTPDLRLVAGRAITEVLATQFKLSAVASAPVDGPIAGQTQPYLVGSVRLTGGRISGGVYLQLPETFATKLTAALLGRSAADLADESEAADVTGELCNMIAGRVAAGLAASGYSSILSTPTVSRGRRLALETTPGGKTCRSGWTCEGHLLTVTLQLTFGSR